MAALCNPVIIAKQKWQPHQNITSLQSKVHVEGLCTEQAKQYLSQHSYQLDGKKKVTLSNNLCYKKKKKILIEQR